MFPDLARFTVTAIFLVIAAPLPLMGEDLKLIPAVTLKEEINDNIFLAVGSRSTDFITTTTPSLDYSSASERRNIAISTGFNWLNYARNDVLNSVDYFVQSSFDYRFDPRLSVSAGAGYVRNSRPDRVDLDTGLALKTGSDRQTYQLSGNYAVSEKSTSTISYVYSREIYDNPGLLTTTVHNVSIAQDYDLDSYLRQAKLVGSFGYSRDLTNISQVDNYTGTVGLMKKYNEQWGISLNGGGRYTHSEFDVTTLITPMQLVTSKASSDGSGWIGNLSLNYSSERLNGALSLRHDITTASGRSGSTERTGISTNLSNRFTRELSGFFGLGYSWNRSDRNQFSAQLIDEKNLTVNCGLRYDISSYMSLEGNYRYNNIYYSQSSTQASQNVFMLRLTMRRDVMDL
ncbi:MAG: hypothetical protein CXR30_13170 [Geobacter sp.]|nr:MAG: hypothetical protein CXR30_13170 [Geobacter sp.]